MYIKQIIVRIVAGKRQEFFRWQDVWTAAMAASDGFRGLYIAIAEDDPHHAELNCFWADKEALACFMREKHAALEAATDIRECYDAIEVRFLESEAPPPIKVLGTEADRWRRLAVASEAYRLSIALRAVLEAGLIDHLAESDRGLADLAAETGLSDHHCGKLVNLLVALGLVVRSGDRLRLDQGAAALLTANGARSLRALFLHNAHPTLIGRWNELEGTLGLHPPETPRHTRFMAAMADIARGGQAAAIATLIAPIGGARILDVGGALGDNALALAAAAPEVRIDILDLPETAGAAGRALAGAEVQDCVRFISGDYRAALPVGPYDIILMANILRGETPSEALALVERARAQLADGGTLWVVDLLQTERGDESDVMAALFGLHLPHAIAPTAAEIERLLHEADFAEVSRHRIEPPLVANLAIAAQAGSRR
jgi:ubiquinone/menaquinone biosynthesis C-methylase UbiE